MCAYFMLIQLLVSWLYPWYLPLWPFLQLHYLSLTWVKDIIKCSLQMVSPRKNVKTLVLYEEYSKVTVKVIELEEHKMKYNLKLPNPCSCSTSHTWSSKDIYIRGNWTSFGGWSRMWYDKGQGIFTCDTLVDWER